MPVRVRIGIKRAMCLYLRAGKKEITTKFDEEPKTFVSDFVLLGGKGYLCICQLIKL